MKRKIAKIGMWTMFVGSFGLIVLGILYMAHDHNYGIGACHFIWAFVAVSQALTLRNQEEVMIKNEKLERMLNLATETSINEAKKNAHLIAEKNEVEAKFKEYRHRRELEEKDDWEKRQEQEQLLNVATNVMHAHLIASAINPEWCLYEGEDGKVMPFPDYCVKLAKDLIEKSK